jgi:hypothetical protein
MKVYSNRKGWNNKTVGPNATSFDHSNLLQNAPGMNNHLLLNDRLSLINLPAPLQLRNHLFLSHPPLHLLRLMGVQKKGIIYHLLSLWRRKSITNLKLKFKEWVLFIFKLIWRNAFPSKAFQWEELDLRGIRFKVEAYNKHKHDQRSEGTSSSSLLDPNWRVAIPPFQASRTTTLSWWFRWWNPAGSQLII